MYWCGFRSALIHVGTFFKSIGKGGSFQKQSHPVNYFVFCSLEVPDMYKVFIFCNAMLMCVCYYLPYSRYVMLFSSYFCLRRGGSHSRSRRLKSFKALSSLACLLNAHRIEY